MTFTVHQQHKEKPQIQITKGAVLKEIHSTCVREITVKTKYYLISSAILVLLGQGTGAKFRREILGR